MTHTGCVLRILDSLSPSSALAAGSCIRSIIQSLPLKTCSVNCIARPTGLHEPGALLMQMKHSLYAHAGAFSDGAQYISHCLGLAFWGHTTPTHVQKCMCDLRALHDERHLVLVCPVMQSVIKIINLPHGARQGHHAAEEVPALWAFAIFGPVHVPGPLLLRAAPLSLLASSPPPPQAPSSQRIPPCASKRSWMLVSVHYPQLPGLSCW